MYAVVLLVVVAIVSLLITRIATIALTLTGMARPAARFQARSALTGAGFTTAESEAVVQHPVRRRIIMALMLLGGLGVATSMAGLLAGFLSTETSGQALMRGALLVLGLASVYALSLSHVVDRRLSTVIARVLRRFTSLDVRDYAALLHISSEYAVKEMVARPDGWLASRTWVSWVCAKKGSWCLEWSGAMGHTWAPPAGTPTSSRGIRSSSTEGPVRSKI